MSRSQCLYFLLTPRYYCMHIPSRLKNRDPLNIINLKYTTAVSKPKPTPLPIATKRDLIGPPNPSSNLRPIVFFIPKNESKYEKEFRERRGQVQEWNEDFWTKHNTRFLRERDEFTTTIGLQKTDSSSGKPLEETLMTAEEMSIFYKKFLDKNWKLHLNYNFEWYKKNIHLAFLASKVQIHRLFVRK